jgi:hypothetical protein
MECRNPCSHADLMVRNVPLEAPSPVKGGLDEECRTSLSLLSGAASRVASAHVSPQLTPRAVPQPMEVSNDH